MFDIKVDASRVNLKLDKIPDAVRDALVVAITLDSGELLGEAQSKASGDLLQVKSGRFLRSIKAGISRRKNSVRGRVYSRDERAGLFEWGGSIRAHEIRPKNARALAFLGREGIAFAGVVHHPKSKFSKRAIIHSAFDAMKDQIADDITQAALSAVGRVAAE